ncbi:MAG: hypothetical protein GY928_01790, partial [Colwellia sp.]|nr:hypothetical protein [Colwellia sp.]
PRGKKSGGFNDYADTGSNGLIIDLISTSNRTFAPIGGRNNGESYCGKPPINEPYSGSEEYGVDGLCVCIPIGFVQRRNSGAYAPTFNPNGCVKFVNDKFWYETAQVNMESVEKCFANAQADGNIASGVSGRPDGKYYDAVYASDIKDLRMSTKRLPHKEIREKAKRMAIAGEVRGYDGVPFTQIQTNEWSNGEFNTASIQDTSVCSVGDIVSVERWDSTVYDTTVITEVVNATQLRFRDIVGRKANGYVVIAQTNHGNHSQANPTWTDIIGDPARIAATFPDGVEGQWLPVIPNGTAKDFPLNRKFIQQSPITPRARTDNNGSSWNVSSLSINETTNAWESNNIPSTRVELWSYETQSHFTKGDTNRKALDLGNVFATNDNNISNGNLLLSSLINKVGVGDAEPRNQNVTLINEGGFINGVPNMIAGNEPTHATLTLGATTNPAIKTRSY